MRVGSGTLKQAPHALRHVLLMLFNRVFITGDAPDTWKRILFRTLAKTSKAKIPDDFRPAANLRLLYKVFYGLFWTCHWIWRTNANARHPPPPPADVLADARPTVHVPFSRLPARPRRNTGGPGTDWTYHRAGGKSGVFVVLQWRGSRSFLQKFGSVFERCKCCNSHPFLVLEWY